MAGEWTRAAVAADSEPLLIIDNEVYCVSEWQHEHPGGADVLLKSRGQDASECFVRQGHSGEARALMSRFAVGAVVATDRRPELGARLPGADSPPPRVTADPPASDPPAPPPAARSLEQLQSLLAAIGPPLVMAVLAVLLYSYLF